MKEPKKKGAGLNVAIAQSHRLAGQLVGLQMTSGNLIAIVLSACQVTGGVVWLLVGHVEWFVIVGICILTCALAVVIERLSLGGLVTVRGATRQLNILDEEHHVLLLKENREATAIEAYEYDRRRKKLKTSLYWSIPIIAIGIVISGSLGDVLWHEVFSPTGPVISLLLSLCCAVPISLTFVFSEINKDVSDDALEENIADIRIQEAVLKNAEQDIQISLAMEAFSNVRSDPAKRAGAVGTMEVGLLKRLEAFANRSTVVGDPVEIRSDEQKALSEQPAAPQQIQQPTAITEVGGRPEQAALPEQAETQVEAKKAERTRWKTERESFLTWMAAHPGCTLVQIMEAFNVQRSTAGDWRRRYRKHLEQQLQAVEHEIVDQQIFEGRSEQAEQEAESTTDPGQETATDPELEIIEGELVEVPV